LGDLIRGKKKRGEIVGNVMKLLKNERISEERLGGVSDEMMSLQIYKIELLC
jgi:hypothetical protein